MPGSRQSRSDAGVIALTRALMTEVLGLNSETISKVMKVVRNSGQLQDLKVNLRGMNSVAYKRLNQVIDMIETDKEAKQDEGEPKEEKKAEKPAKKDNKKVNESFLGYLLNELQIDTDELRTDPDVKQDVMRLSRASDSQADAMTQRMQRDKMRKDRQEIQQAGQDNPQKAQLLRKKMALKRQIDKIDDQLKQTGGEQQ